MLSNYDIRERITRMYERMYIDQIFLLVKSLNEAFCYSPNVAVKLTNYGAPEDMKWRRNNINNMYTFWNWYLSVCHQIRYGNFKRKFNPKTNGLVCKLEFYSWTKFKMDLVQGDQSSVIDEECKIPPGDMILHQAQEGIPLTLNNIPIKFCSTEQYGSRHGYYVRTRIYFELECVEFDKRMKAYHLIKGLRRNEKSLFSRLPKELIKVIQSYLLDP